MTSPPPQHPAGSLRGLARRAVATRRERLPGPPFLEHEWHLAALLAVAVVAVYAPILRHGFMTLDDPAYVTGNPHVLAGLTPGGVAWAFTTVKAGYWIPLTWLSLMLDAQLFGANPAGYHATNLLLHAANTVLLLALLHRMTGSLGRSAVVAGIFALHPLRVESVAWVAERKDLLSGFFALLTIWLYVRYTEHRTMPRFALVLVSFALGLMSKAMLVSLPIVLLLLDAWPLGRLQGLLPPTAPAPSRERPEAPLPGWRTVLSEKIPLVALAAGCVFATLYAAGLRGGVIHARPLSARLATAVAGYASYVEKALVPIDLAVFYPLPEAFGWWRIASAAALLVAISVASIRAWRRAPYLAVGWFWFVVMLLPVIGLVQAGDQAFADRFTYLPLIGLAIAAVWGTHDLAQRFLPAVPLAPVAALALLGMALLSRHQVGYWQDNTRLFTHALDVTEANWLAHTNVGHALLNEGRIGAAAPHFFAALRAKPDCGEAELGLGSALRINGWIDQAIQHYERAVELIPHDGVACNNLGEALVAAGRFDEAIGRLRGCVALVPDSSSAHFNLARAFAGAGDLDAATAAYGEALRLSPGFAAAREELAAIRTGRRVGPQASAARES